MKLRHQAQVATAASSCSSVRRGDTSTRLSSGTPLPEAARSRARPLQSSTRSALSHEMVQVVAPRLHIRVDAIVARRTGRGPPGTRFLDGGRSGRRGSASSPGRHTHWGCSRSSGRNRSRSAGRRCRAAVRRLASSGGWWPGPTCCSTGVWGSGSWRPTVRRIDRCLVPASSTRTAPTATIPAPVRTPCSRR